MSCFDTVPAIEVNSRVCGRHDMELTIPGGNGVAMRHARRCMGEMLRAHGVGSEMVIAAMAQCLAEAGANAIEHTLSGHPGGRIRMAFTVFRDHVEGIVTDGGLPEVPPVPKEEGRRGMKIIRSFATRYGFSTFRGHGHLLWKIALPHSEFPAAL